MTRETYIKEVLLGIAILILLLEIDIAYRINRQDLSIFGHDSLPGSSGLGGRARRRCFGALDLGLAIELLLARVLLLHAALPAVHGLQVAILVLVSRRGGSSSRCGGCLDAGDVQGVSPRGLSRKLDVPADELLLSLPAHVEGKVVSSTTHKHKQTQ